MKQILIFVLFLYCAGSAAAQQKDSARLRPDTNAQAHKTQATPGTAQLKKDSNSNSGARTRAAKVADTGRAAKATTPTTDRTTTAKKDSSKVSSPVKIRKVGPDTSRASADNATPVPENHLLRNKLQAEALYSHAHGLLEKDYLPAFLRDRGALHPLTGGIQIHSSQHQDNLFYCFLGISMLLGFIKMLFPRYFNQIFWFFLHPNDRKKNQSEQISAQNIIPSLLLNLFFAITGGLFLSEIFKPSWPGASFWRNWIIFTGVLITVYLIKFLVIKLSGWLFNSPVAAATYNNVVFSINKVIGLLLLPATLLIAYGTDHSTSFAFSFAIILIGILLIYRYIASFLLIKGKLKVNAFHFILYLCAVEIVPLLLVYKVLFNNIGQLI